MNNFEFDGIVFDYFGNQVDISCINEVVYNLTLLTCTVEVQLQFFSILKEYRYNIFVIIFKSQLERKPSIDCFQVEVDKWWVVVN